jgi:hypothetical protein
MKKAFVMLVKQLYTQQAAVANCSANLQWTAKTDSVISIVVERKLTTDINYIAINTKTSTGAFALNNFIYSDDLTNISSTVIKYRFKMNIAADTSFYLDSLSINFTPKPNLGADKNITRCSDSSLNLTALFTTTGLTALWTLNGTAVANPSAVNTSGNYILRAVNNSGCADTALVTVNFIAKPNLGADKAVGKCTDSTYNLTTAFTTTGLTTVWTINGIPVTTPSAVATPGTYQLIAINTSGCSDTALISLSNDAQLCPAIIEKITISPNPASDKIIVSVAKRIAAKIEISVHNTSGQKIYNTSAQQAAGTQTYNVPMAQKTAGIYYVTVFVNGKKEVVKKIMKR